MLDPVIILITQLAIAGLFGQAAWHKSREWPRIVGVVAGYRIFPSWANRPLSGTVIIVELGLAVCTLISPQALLPAALMLLVYAGAMGFNIARGNDEIDCGCSTVGTSGPRLVWAMVIRNVSIGLFAIAASIQSSSARQLVWIDFLSAALGFAVVSALYASLDRNLALPRKEARA